jgi:hypothetical protein
MARFLLFHQVPKCGGGSGKVGFFCQGVLQTERLMTYTFKLSRRIAVARLIPVAALLFGTGCDTVDSLGAAEAAQSGLLLSPARATAETQQKIRLAFRDQLIGELTPSFDVEWTVVGGGGLIAPDGSFTATQPGVYTIIGKKGNGNGNNGQGKGNGGPNTDTSTVVVVPPPSTLVSVEMTPETAALQAGEHLQFDAVGRDGSGATVAIGVEWSATGGTIDAGGHYIAGSTSGTFRVIAFHGATGLADTAAVDVSAPTTSPAPAPAPTPIGMNGVMENHLGASPLAQASLAGEWTDPTTSNYRWNTATDIPSGSSGVLEVTWPSGMSSGVSPGQFRGWSDIGGSERYKELRLSTRVRILGKDFENQAVGTKLWYVGYGNKVNDNDAFLMLQGSGTQSIMSAMKLNVYVSPDQTSGSIGIQQNVDTRALFTVGSWHDVTVYLNTGTPDRADGIVQVWIDGTLVTDRKDVQFLTSKDSFTQGFFSWQWTPVWGGMGGTRTRNDTMQIDHIAASGVLQ